MTREPIIPDGMENIVEKAGYLPAVRSGELLFCAGQVGRDTQMQVITDPEAQFEACWHNLKRVLTAGGCTFADVVDLTSYHVGLSRHMPLFRTVKDRHFPRSTCAWTCIGVSELAHPGLLAEIRAIARLPG